MQGYDPAGYGEAFADVYDDWYAEIGDTAGCLATIARLAGGGRVLELGVGTGRLALPLRTMGVDVTGIDASPSMLARLRAKPGGEEVPLIEGDFAELTEVSVYEVVFAAFNTINNVADEGAQRRTFTRVAAALRPGGRFLVESFVPATDHDAPLAAVEPSRIDDDLVVLTASVRDPRSGIVVGQHIELSARGIRLHPWRIRPTPPEELDDMAAAAGLELEARHDGWRGTPFGPTTANQVSTYCRR